ncbi:TolC family protein [Tsuneonella sp. CC-YZS046]|uniref:TolC family protein n=1 Tax=Tsuneonella sp. CC-YZS046 TaxID=3042152 RepID=UPI002D767EAA|nr:TolC family protein [Tsuneonella sp. CC-YZS046]WRO65548.1 TolC family protein [Tsuneonella sp. CC-YZS046]
MAGAADYGFGDQGPLLTLETAVDEAVAWHPSIEEASGNVDASTENIAASRAGYLPQISVGLGSGYDNTVRSNWRPRASVSASQMLYDFGKVSSSVAIAEADTRDSEAQLLQAVDSLVRDTSYAFVEIQRTNDLLQVAGEQLASIREISELVGHRFERGAATRSDALQARARVQAAQATIEEIEAERERWISNLAYLLGRESIGNVSADMPDWFLTACDQDAVDWGAVPAIMQVRAQRDHALGELDRSRADGLPTVSFGADAGTEIADPVSGRKEYSFGLNISSALYSGGASKARVRSATAALGAADAAEAKVRNEIRRQFAEARGRIDGFTRVMATLDLRESSMRETGKLYRLQYLEMGTRTLVDLLNAEQELHQVRFEFVNTKHDLRRLQADCLFFSGATRSAYGLNKSAFAERVG